MNKKLLLTLFFVPIGFLAADKVLGLNTPGGGKEKQQQTTSQTAQSAESNGDATLAAVRDVSTLDREELLKFKVALEKLKSEAGVEAMEEEYHAVERYWEGNLDRDQVEVAFWAFLDENVKTPLREMDVFDIHATRQFSRCGSGYHYTINKSDEVTVRGEGYMVRDEGCWDRPIAKFQYDFAAKDVRVKISDELGSLSIIDFLKMYDAV